jgi:hypothetical protein
VAFAEGSSRHGCELLSVADWNLISSAPTNHLIPDKLETGLRNHEQQSGDPDRKLMEKFLDICHWLILGQACPELVLHYHPELAFTVAAFHVGDGLFQAAALCLEVQSSRTVQPDRAKELRERTRCGGRGPKDEA